jgi:hypothetical protein
MPHFIELSRGQLSDDAELPRVRRFDKHSGLTRAFAAALHGGAPPV